MATHSKSPRTPATPRAAARTRGGELRPWDPWLLIVALLAVGVYLNGLPGEFVFDDKLIQRDPRINGSEPFWRIFVTDYWYKFIGTSADLYRPLTIASYAINRMVAGLNPPAFHAVNILLHALASVVVVRLVDALLEERRLAVVAGLLFAVHPVHTEAVTGIVGRAEVLSALFLLSALWLQSRDYALRGGDQRRGWVVALSLYLCALASKETAIVGPGLVALVDYVRQFNRGTGADDASAARWDWRRTLRLAAWYVGVAAVYLLIRYAVVGRFIQRPPARSYLLLFGQPLVTRIITAAEILAIYLRLLFFPLSLSADYSYRQVPLLDAPDAVALVGGLAGLGILAACVWALRRRVGALAFALGFFVVAYSVVGNFPIPLQVLVAERLMYLPSVGFCIALAWAWVRCAAWAAAHGRAWRRLAEAALAVIVVLYGVRTVVRNAAWRSAETIYAATVRDAPECFAARFNYSAILLRDPRRTAEALEHLLKAYEIRQDHYPSLVNLASAYLSLGQPEKAREIAQRGLQVQPNGREIRGVLAQAERQLQQRQPPGS